MDRDEVLAVLATVLLAFSLFVGGAWPTIAMTPAGGRDEERLLWQGIWLRFAPATLVLAGLVGWALQEPVHSDESVSGTLVAAGIVVGAIWARALARALVALRSSTAPIPAATIGLVRPRVVIAPWFAATLDPDALRAVWQHECAHARHRDPLRIWMAQWATDLLWPLPGAASRFQRWMEALEIARDEEVRERGTFGEDLAVAVIAAARCGSQSRGGWAAMAGSCGALSERIARLLAPLPEAPRGTTRVWPAVLLVASLVGACAFGYRFGETVVRSLPGVLT